MDAEQEIIELRRQMAELEQRLGGGRDLDLGGGADVAPVIITGGTGTNHTGDVYANGKHNPATETGVTIKVQQIDGSASIPVNSEFTATRQLWDNGGVDTYYWTIDIPRWL